MAVNTCPVISPLNPSAVASIGPLNTVSVPAVPTDVRTSKVAIVSCLAVNTCPVKSPVISPVIIPVTFKVPVKLESPAIVKSPPASILSTTVILLPVTSPSLVTLNVSAGVSAPSLIVRDLFSIVTSPFITVLESTPKVPVMVEFPAIVKSPPASILSTTVILLPVTSPSLVTLNLSAGVSAPSLIVSDLFAIVTLPPILVTPLILVVIFSLTSKIAAAFKAAEKVTFRLNSDTPSTITLSFKNALASTVKLALITSFPNIVRSFVEASSPIVTSPLNNVRTPESIVKSPLKSVSSSVVTLPLQCNSPFSVVVLGSVKAPSSSTTPLPTIKVPAVYTLPVVLETMNLSPSTRILLLTFNLP